MHKSLLVLMLIATLFTAPAQAGVPNPLPWANPWDVGMDYEFINRAFSDVGAAIQEGNAPGAVGIIIKDGHIIARRAVGYMQTRDAKRPRDASPVTYQPTTQPMYEMTIFDLASVTKMVSTTTSIMILAERGELDLDEAVATYIPSFAGRAKGEVTVRQLLTHTSGLPSWRAFYNYCTGPEEVYRSIDEDIALEYKPGDKRIYSDIGFITLGRLVEALSGQRLNEFAQENIFAPLGMEDTGYIPELHKRLRTAPTEYDPMRNQLARGIVHDENTRVLGGISGHAGLFSTANDMAVFAQMLLNEGAFDGTRILKPETVAAMTTPQEISAEAVENGTDFLRYRRQLLGWWGMDEKVTLYYMGGLPSPRAYGHTGFTGTVMYIDPEHDLAAILLSNAVHPRREEAGKSALRRAFYYNISKALVGPKNLNIQGE